MSSFGDLLRIGYYAERKIYQNHTPFVGATAGFVVNAADDVGNLATCPASKTAATLVQRITGIEIGERITGIGVAGQIESAGGAVTVDLALHSVTVAAADLTTTAVTNGGITQISVTADTAISATNGEVTGTLNVLVAAGVSYFILCTVTTAASTDVDLSSLIVIVKRDPPA